MAASCQNMQAGSTLTKRCVRMQGAFCVPTGDKISRQCLPMEVVKKLLPEELQFKGQELRLVTRCMLMISCGRNAVFVTIKRWWRQSAEKFFANKAVAEMSG